MFRVCDLCFQVLARVTSECVRPFADRPNEGTITYNCRLTMVSTERKRGERKDAEVELGKMIDKSFRDTRVIEPSSLCIVPGKWCWALKVDIDVLDWDGNCPDAAHLAVTSALMHCRRPTAAVRPPTGDATPLFL